MGLLACGKNTHKTITKYIYSFKTYYFSDITIGVYKLNRYKVRFL